MIRALSFETGGKVLLRGFTNTIQDMEVKVIDDANMVIAAIDSDGQLLVSPVPAQAESIVCVCVCVLIG